MTVGSFVFMLHSHLPFYRKAGMWPFGEENLYECMAHSYIPLLNAINELLSEGIKAKLTIGLTPVLAEQLNDEHLKNGFENYVNSRIEAVREDLNRYPNDSVAHSQHLEYLAKFYFGWYNGIKESFVNKYNRDLIGEFRRLQDLGCIEITTSAATHGFLPLLSKDSSINAQLKTGVDAYKKLFGRKPRGAWMPECAYRPGYEATAPDGSKYYRPAIEVSLQNNGIDYVFVESHQIEGGVSVGSRRSIGIYGNIEYIPLPARPATGLSTYEAYWLPEAQVAVMGRNHEGGYQIWSAADGYPGDGCYREFHKKDDNSGMHYWRITSPTSGLGDKMLYDPVLAMSRISENSDHYVNILYHRLNDYKKATGKEGLFMVSFDTELYGHWWFEGVEFIKQVIKKLSVHIPEVKRETASEYLDANQPSAAVQLPESSWGQGGHFWVWQNHQTEWMWPIIHCIERRVESIVSKYPTIPQDKLLHRALNQLVRESLLLESSDWPFLVTTWQARDYAVERFRKHQENFERIASMIENNSIDDGYLQSLESVDNLFSDIDYRVFTEIKQGSTPQETEQLLPLYR
jgi:1,4-alpha-glucan branching enzyme